MDKIDKAIARLSDKERTKLKQLLTLIGGQKTKGLDVKKLKGREDIYRARKGGLRILYRTDGEHVYLLAIERRNDNTYK